MKLETRQRNHIAKLEEWKALVDFTGTKGVSFCDFQYYRDGEKGHKLPCVLENG